MLHTHLTALAAASLLVTASACSQSSAPAPAAPEPPAAGPVAADTATTAAAATCGPQSPRDISQAAGSNTLPVPAGDTPNLCNVHFHDPFEHSGFSSVPEVSAVPGEPVCSSVEIGDQVEFHWVYTNCPANPSPAKGLANCVCDREDLVLRVFAQAYVVGEQGVAPAQPTANLTRYVGSTTGPSYDDQTCSQARVNWEVAPTVDVVSKQALGEWCESNPWPDEDHPHGSRALVTKPAWLSPM